MHDAALTVHITCRDWIGVRERVHDERKQRPNKKDDVCKEADRTEPEGPVCNIVATANQEADHGNGVAKIE
jgi:hypothetical protein